MSKLKTTALCVVMVSLAGCQSFPFHFGMQDRTTVSPPDMSSYFAQRLNDGKRHLEAYRLAAAIDAFRQSSYHPDFAGEAYNGMGIAYDRLGRYDLAERFFNQAVEAAPDDPRFARNASRFQTMMAARSLEAPVPGPVQAEQPAALAQSELQLERVAQAVDAEIGPALPQRLQRVSAREVTIASRQDWTARLASSENSRRPAVVHIGRPQRSERHLAGRTSAGYPVRFAIADIPEASEASERDQGSEGSTFANSNGEVRVRVSGQLRAQDRPAYPITFRLAPPS